MEGAVSVPSPDFPFQSRFVYIGGYKIHYVEHGEGMPVLFLHGNPTSSYLWRNVLPKVAEKSRMRGIAMDLLGFGRSDKPGVHYSPQLHTAIVTGFIEQLGLKNVILVLHDWGGPIGMAYAVNHPGNIKGICLMESFLWDMSWDDFGKFKPVFKAFRSPLGYILNQVLNFFVNRVLPGSIIRRENLTSEALRRYREPFPDVKSRKAVRAFPQLLPIEGKPKVSRQFIRSMEEKLPLVKAPVQWIRATPGTIVTESTRYHLLELSARLPQLTVSEFGPGLHYLQEDDPGKLVDLVLAWMQDNRLAANDEPAAGSTYRRVA